MTDQTSKLRALCLASIVLLSSFTVVIAFSGAGVAHTKSAGNVSIGDSEMVNVSDATIDPSNESRIPVAVNVSGTGLQTNEIRLRAVNELDDVEVNTTLLSEADFSSNASKGNITLQTSPLTGPTPTFTLNVTAYDVNTGQPISGATNDSTITVDDTTSPTISNVNLGNDGFDKFKLTFDSSEELGALASNLSITITGPSGATYSFDRHDFFLANTDGNHTYQLHVLQAFDDGGGTYSASIDTVEDHFGNDGSASAPSATHDYTTDFSDKTVKNRPGGPDMDTSNVTMHTTKIGNQFLFIQLENDTANFGRRDISGEGATENTELWVNFTVDSFNPDVLMGTANVESWNYTLNDDGSANVNVSLQPASTERNFTAWQNGVNTPGNWGSKYDGSDRSMDAVVDFGVGNLSAAGGGGPEGLDGARLTTDSQVFSVPQLDDNGNLSIDVASPHCVADTAAPANECTGDEVNDGGFYEAVIPSAFYEAEWGVSELSSGDVAVDYSSSASASSETEWNVSVREDGALVLNGTNIHYSDGTIEISQVQSEDSSDDGGTSGGSSSISSTEVTAEQTDDGTVATVDQVSIDDPTVTVSVEGATTESMAVSEVTISFDQGTNVNNTISVSASESRPDDTPTPPSDRTLSYVTVEVEGNLADRISEGSFTIDLANSDVEPETVTAHRYHEGEWQEVETTVVDETTVKVTTPGYSVFAISADRSAEQVTETTTMTSTETTAPAETTTITRTSTAEPTTAATQTTETGGMPGFDVGASLAALIVVMFWTKRRFN